MKNLFKAFFTVMMILSYAPSMQAQVSSPELLLAGIADAMAYAGNPSLAAEPSAPVVSESDPARDKEFVVRIFGNTYVVFRMNTQGNVAEYFAVQEIPTNLINPGTIQKVVYNEGSDISVTTDDGKIYQCYVSDESLDRNSGTIKVPAAGISNFKVNGDAGYPLDKLSGHFTNRTGGATGSGELGGCDSQCLSGGCGSTSCSRATDTSIMSGSCSVDCKTGYFACCRDVFIHGCYCIKDTCCK